PMTPQDADARQDRLERALLSQIRQEFGAPLAAILGFAEILAEESGRHGFSQYLSDLQRIHDAAAQLQTLIGTLLDPSIHPAERDGAGASFAAWRSHLRHELRTP